MWILWECSPDTVGIQSGYSREIVEGGIDRGGKDCVGFNCWCKGFGGWCVGGVVSDSASEHLAFVQ